MEGTAKNERREACNSEVRRRSKKNFGRTMEKISRRGEGEDAGLWDERGSLRGGGKEDQGREVERPPGAPPALVKATAKPGSK